MRLARVAAPLIAVLLVWPATAGAELDALWVDRGRLVDGEGRTVILRGLNVVYKPAPYLPTDGGGERTSFNARDAARLRNWGMNAIRLGVTWKALQPQPGQVDLGYVARLRRIARLAERAGLYVLLDMHQDLYAERFQGNGAPDWAIRDDGLEFRPRPDPFPLNYLQPAVGRSFTSFWENRDGIRTEYARAFAVLARAFRGDAGVVGYDLFNEPVCELGVKPCALPPGPEAAVKWLLPFYRELVPALRRADPSHPVFYEDGVTVNAGYPFLIGATRAARWPFPDNGLSFHVYCGRPLLRATPSCPAQERQAIANGVRIAGRNRVAPVVTEFGATDRLAVLRRLARYLDDAGLGWLYWQYKSYGDPTTAASGEPGGADAESVVSERGRIKAAKLRILARPYPERIAGSDARWSFDERSGAFSLSYRPRAGAQTLVSLPLAVHYRRGYRTSASGASVGSSDAGDVLALNAAPGARRVSLRVARR